MQISLKEQVTALKGSGKLLPEAWANLNAWAKEKWLPAWAQEALGQLIVEERWEELNNRFYKQNEFGTAGIRGRTIGQYTPAAERGTPNELGAPEHAAVGSATLNDFNILRATAGLFRYCQKHPRAPQEMNPPKLVIAHDVRHFSPHFAQLAASAWVKLGGVALIFDGPRSTPQLSFTVRHTKASAGVVITASHNPAHDNGYKVYWNDGSQIVLEHDEGIIREVNATPLKAVKKLLKIELEKVVTLPAEVDEAYVWALKSTLVEPEILKEHPPKMIYSSVHGTGRVMIPRAMEAYGAGVTLVEEQAAFDGRFPTVKSPNPQNEEALSLAMKAAEKENIDVVVATDPDCDRMGAAVRKKDGGWLVLTGNVIGALMAEDRLTRLKELGQLPTTGHPHATLIKTFVTTPLQDAIAAAHGIQCVNCITGFKWIGARLKMYEENLKNNLAQSGLALNYDACSDDARRKLMLEHSRWYVFGGEESYGYLGNDRVRDKDGNAATLMFAEMLSRLSAKKKTLAEALEAMYLKYGYFAESPLTVAFEGAEGAVKLKKLTSSYAKTPPKTIGDFVVRGVKDFAREAITDADGQEVPKTNMIWCELDDGTSFAVRPSGTEPTVKFYCFAREAVREAADLQPAMKRAQDKLESLKAALKADAASRVG